MPTPLVDTDLLMTALLRKRQLHQRITGAAVQPEDQPYEVFTTAGAHDHYSQHKTMKAAKQRADETAQQHPGTVVSCWSPVRAHVYQAVRHVGAAELSVLHGEAVRRPIDTSRPARSYLAYFDTPEELVTELVQYIATTPALEALAQAVRLNLTELLTKGVYCSKTAVKAFIPIADAAVRRYKDQYGGTNQEQYPMDIRRMTAERLLALFEQEAREEPDKFVDEYVKQKEQPAAQPQVVTVPGSGDKAPIVINVYAKTEEPA